MQKGERISLDTPPKSRSISAKNIEAAYVDGNAHHQRRIERYGRLNRKILRNIGKPAKKDGTSG